MSNLVKYEPWTPDEIEAAEREIDAESDFLKVREGTTVVRVLPKRPGTIARDPLVKSFQHYFKLPGMQSAVSFNCPRMLARRPCLACRKADELAATGNNTDYELAGEVRQSMRIYANVIDRGNPERGPVIWAFGKQVRDDIMPLVKSPDWGDCSDPTENGYDLIITRKGTGKNDTKYKVVGSRTCSPLSDDAAQVEEWLSTMHDLDRYLRAPSDEEIARMMPGGWGVGAAAPPAGGPRRRRAANVQDDVIDAEGVVVE